MGQQSSEKIGKSSSTSSPITVTENSVAQDISPKQSLSLTQAKNLLTNPQITTVQRQQLVQNISQHYGNRTVQRLVSSIKTANSNAVQRMPDTAALKAELGEPKEGDAIRKNSPAYRAVLTALDAYNTYISNTEIGPEARKLPGQKDKLFNLLDAIEVTCQAYAAGHKATDRKGIRMEGILNQVQIEKTMVDNKVKSIGSATRRGNFGMWKDVLPGDLLLSSTAFEVKGAVTFKGQGGINAVKGVKLKSSGYEGVFKPDKDKIEQLNASGQTSAEHVRSQASGIRLTNPEFAKRSVAMSRIDQLLGANVIAKTQLAKFDGKLGSYQQKASGEQFAAIGKAGNLVKTDAEKAALGQNGNDVISMEDPVLRSSLSKLQLIDAIAGQIDRHGGNFFVEKDQNGKVVKLTAIDHDLSFGTNTDPTKGSYEYPGMAEVVDKELALRIIALDENDLREVLQGLLNKKEINATVKRLNILKAELVKLQAANKLLAPNEWAQAQKGDLKSSYWSDQMKSL